MRLMRAPSTRALINLVGRARSIANIPEALQNGILESDTYFRTGLPGAKFRLPEAKDSQDQLNEIFQQNSSVDPFKFVSKGLRSVSHSITELIGSDHPVLKSVAQYIFTNPGKRIRIVILLCLARAMAHGRSSPVFEPHLIRSLSGPDLFKNRHVVQQQERLSQITEMIHSASLLHDDVIDGANVRRGRPVLNLVYGNKLAILGGDFLLARASVALARLRDPQVIEIMSTVIEHLVKGEIMQMKPLVQKTLADRLDFYTLKSFYKTASLISGSCKSLSILAGYDTHMQEIAEEYGKNLGLAFQITDDLLDFVGGADTGKDIHNDLKQGLSTAPVLYAADGNPELSEMMARTCANSGDVQHVLDCVQKSNGIFRARELAYNFGEKAVAAILQLPPSEARSACIELVRSVLTREK